MVTAVLANGTVAGTQITNQATATYEDPNDPNNTPITTISNTVVVQVAEVAGITVQAAGSDFVAGGDADSDGAVDPGDEVYYIYEVTNVGNDPTEFFVPNTATITTNNGTLSGQIEISYDGTTWGDPRDTSFNADGDGITNPIAPNGKVLVRVPIEIDNDVVSGDSVEVLLGNTPGDGQNQDYSPTGSQDVYTVDAPDGASGIDVNNDGNDDEVAGVPANGTREASARQLIEIDTTLDTQPLVTLDKTLSNYAANDAASLTDDQLTYELSFKVEDTDTTGNTPAFTPGTLYPVSGISVDGGTGSHILVSDALPDHTVLSGTPTVPAGWTVVYTSDDPATVDANDADWFTSSTDAGLTGAITRVGFISDASIISLAPGSVVGNFRLTVQTTNLPTALTSATIANMAQVFGSGDPGGDPNDLVNDESGDNVPSNYNPDVGGGTPGFDQPGDGFIPDTDDDGVPEDIDPNDPAAGDGTDPSNTNSGDGPGGEANITTIRLPVDLEVANGPEDEPEAIGPTGTNDDFTNRSAAVDSGDITFDATDNRNEMDPDPVDFANTVLNSGTTAGNITLEPTAPATAADLPDGTIVTVSDPNGATAIYSYSGGTFTRTGGTFGGPIVIPNVDPDDEVTYGVRVDLPDGTPLSTDDDGSGNPIGGFPVPITATVDDGNDTASNITIDRVYTGYLRLVKESRILQGSGPAVQAGQGDFSADPKNPAPGNIIEYRVTYENISETVSGSNNVVLFAENVVINEDGTDGGNNWALDNDNNSVIDTSNVQGSATDSNGGSITYYNGAPATNPTTDTFGSDVNSDVTRYVDVVPGLVGPGESGFLLFRRVVN